MGQSLILAFIFTMSTVHAKVEHKSSAPTSTHSTAAHKSDAHSRVAGLVKSDDSKKLLIKGNKRFLSGNALRTGATHKDVIRLSKGQQPHAIVLSCSDSRVPPEIIFDQRLGEIFVVRTAGQTLDYSAIASIEYAVAHLGANLIVIMGHESCGAVKAALDTMNGADAGSPSLNKLVANLHPHLKRFSELSRTDGLLVESAVNVEGVYDDLIAHSDLIRKFVESGDVKIMKALYHLSSGQVEWR